MAAFPDCPGRTFKFRPSALEVSVAASSGLRLLKGRPNSLKSSKLVGGRSRPGPGRPRTDATASWRHPGSRPGRPGVTHASSKLLAERERV